MRLARCVSTLLHATLLLGPVVARSAPADVCDPIHRGTIGSFGDGQGQFNNPASVCALPTGEVAVVDFWNSRVQLFAADGTYLSSWGVGELISAVAADPLGRLFVLSYSGTVRRCNPYGVVDMTWLPPERDSYYLGTDLFVHDNQVYVAANTTTVTRFTLDGAYLGDIPTKPGLNGIAVGSNGDLYASNESSHDICRYSTAGQLLSCWGSLGSGPQQFNRPRGMTITPGGYLLVADDYNDRISVWTGAGQFVCLWGTSGSGLDQFLFTADVALGPGGEYYVCDFGNDRVHKLGNVPTAIARRTWGEVKALYR